MNEKVLACVYAAIEEANEDRDGRPPLEKSLATAIHGSTSGFDSLGLINFMVAVEEAVEQELGATIVLGDDRALTRDPNPLESVQALVDYIDVLLTEQQAVGPDARG